MLKFNGQNRMNNGVVILNVAKFEKVKVKVAYLISMKIGQDDGHVVLFVLVTWYYCFGCVPNNGRHVLMSSQAIPTSFLLSPPLIGWKV